MKRQTQAYLYALSAVLLWSTVATAFKLSLETFSYLQLLFYSVLTALLVLFILLIANGELAKLKSQNKKDWAISILSGGLNPFLYYLVLFKAYELLPAQEALSLNYSWAVMVVIFSVIFLKQKINVIGIGGILLSFLGLLLIATKGDLLSLNFSNPLGTALAFGSSLIWATFWIINLKDNRDVLVKLFLSFAAGFVFIAIYIVITGTPLTINETSGLLAAVYVGLFEMGVTFVVWLKALKLSENTAKVSSLIYLSPFLSLNLINIILGEKILFSTIIGITLIIGGILIQKIKVR